MAATIVGPLRTAGRPEHQMAADRVVANREVADGLAAEAGVGDRVGADPAGVCSRVAELHDLIRRRAPAIEIGLARTERDPALDREGGARHLSHGGAAAITQVDSPVLNAPTTVSPATEPLTKSLALPATP